MFRVPEKYRLTTGRNKSSFRNGNNGAFIIPNQRKPKHTFFIIASDGAGWEHVSISMKGAVRPPSWSDMCYIKDLFWGDEDADADEESTVP